MLSGFLEALRVLTILPISNRGPLTIRERTFYLTFFPIVGAVFGLTSLAVAVFAYPGLSYFAAWAIPVFGILFSGATHFVGLCRTMSAVLARGTNEHRLDLLARENVPLDGVAVALMVSFGKSFALLQATILDRHSLLTLVCFAPIFSRYLGVLLALGSSKLEGDRKQVVFRHRVFIVVATTVMILLLAVIARAVTLSILMLVTSLGGAVVLQAVSLRRLGSIRPPVLGALVEISEVLMFWAVLIAVGLGIDVSAR